MLICMTGLSAHLSSEVPHPGGGYVAHVGASPHHVHHPHRYTAAQGARGGAGPEGQGGAAAAHPVWGNQKETVQ